MFIELTDHLRCLGDHDEGYVVLLPDEVKERDVVRGRLGCPTCGRVMEVAHGVLEAGDSPTVAPRDDVPSGEALVALTGLGGPGGYLVLAGAAAVRASEVRGARSGVHLVLVDPPAGIEATDGTSVLRAPRLPLRSGSMRAVVLGAPLGGDPHWVAEAARVVLPGLRVVGQGPAPATEALELLAEADGWWVGQRRAR